MEHYNSQLNYTHTHTHLNVFKNKAI